MMIRFTPLLESAAKAVSAIIAEHPETAAGLGPVVTALEVLAADVDSHVAERLALAEEIGDHVGRIRTLIPAGTEAQAINRALKAVPPGPQGLTVEAVEGFVSERKRGLIAAQAWLEENRRPEDGSISEAVWTLLERDTRRRSRHVPPFWGL